MSFKTKRAVLIIYLFALILLVLLFAKNIVENTVLLSVFALSLFIFLLLIIFWWRCPKCKKGLGRTLFTAQHCQHCGEELE